MLLLATLSMATLLLIVFGTRLTYRKLGEPNPNPGRDFNEYPITILKPLKGEDENLEANLESFFHLDYPQYELIFSVAESSDPARKIAARLIRKYPKIDARLIVGDTPISLNPKVNNLIKGYKRAKFDHILISDSNTIVPSNFLYAICSHMNDHVGVVTSLIAGISGKGLGAVLEQTFLNAFYARGMVLGEAAGKPCVVGKSMFFRKSDAERFGGLGSLGNYLAEDYMAGEAFRRLGLDVVVMNQPVQQVLGNYSLSQFWSRHIRWGRIRKSQAPGFFLMEAIMSPVWSAVFAAISMKSLLGIDMSTTAFLYLLAWAACDCIVMQKMNKRGWSQLFTPIAWFLLEIVLIPLRIQVLCGNTVSWRGKRLTLRDGGLLEQDGSDSQSLAAQR